jgi:hypothetical protein
MRGMFGEERGIDTVGSLLWWFLSELYSLPVDCLSLYGRSIFGNLDVNFSSTSMSMEA